MLTKLKSLYTDPLYRNSLALMLNSAFGAFFGLLFWIAGALAATKLRIKVAHVEAGLPALKGARIIISFLRDGDINKD